MKRLTILLLCLLLLTGCADSGEHERTDPSWEEYQAGQELEAPPFEEKRPDYPESFSLAYHKDHTLDPITCGEGIQQDVASLLYEPLFQLDNSFTPVPVLCEGASFDESGTICTLAIRQGVSFSDGSSLTAADAADAIRRAAASSRYSYRLRHVISVTSSNRSGTVTVTLDAPNRGFAALLDVPVVKRGTENQTVPIGTGPYLFVTGSSGDSLLANADWWQGKPLPLTSIPLVHAKDQDTAMYLFSSRRVELLTVDPTGSQVAPTGQVQETSRPTTLLQFVGFNTSPDRIFSSAAARAAFSGGIQREMMADAFLSGHAVPAPYLISPRSSLSPNNPQKAYSRDDTLAALEAAGQNTGEEKELILLVNSGNSFQVSNASFLAESLSLLDWRITVNALPWEDYLAALAAGNFDLYYGEIRLTADWDLTDLVGTGGTLNYGGYTDPATDALLLTFAESENRQAAAYRLFIHLQSMCPIAPICFRDYTVLTHPGVAEGLSPSPGFTFAGLERWTVHTASSIN